MPHLPLCGPTYVGLCLNIAVCSFFSCCSMSKRKPTTQAPPHRKRTPPVRQDERRPGWKAQATMRRPPLTLLQSSNSCPPPTRGSNGYHSCSWTISRKAVVITLNWTTSRQHRYKPSTSLLWQLLSRTSIHHPQHRPPSSLLQ